MNKKSKALPLSQIGPPWGMANSKRGQKYEIIAKDFAVDFPVNSFFNRERVQDWIDQHREGLPPACLDSDSHVKVGFTIASINKAASHPRMGVDAYCIKRTGKEMYRVLSMPEYIKAMDIPGDVRKVIMRLWKQANQSMQGVPFDSLNEGEKTRIELVYEQFEMTKEHVVLSLKQYQKVLDRVRNGEKVLPDDSRPQLPDTD